MDGGDCFSLEPGSRRECTSFTAERSRAWRARLAKVELAHVGVVVCFSAALADDEDAPPLGERRRGEVRGDEAGLHGAVVASSSRASRPASPRTPRVEATPRGGEAARGRTTKLTCEAKEMSSSPPMGRAGCDFDLVKDLESIASVQMRFAGPGRLDADASFESGEQ